ncbi:hypothetical protein L2E82_33421 [Cichorium intybus]|uniref:Uncharacterized protein n=1 Tax=Cichorium intybus TaxID=13427 RepID=A0ACB9BK60_CICIN|nr:hypothetical protein L2E82_33421 [Cichorium intybus]
MLAKMRSRKAINFSIINDGGEGVGEKKENKNREDCCLLKLQERGQGHGRCSEKNKKMMKGSLARHLHVHEISFMSSLPQNNNNPLQFHNFIYKDAGDTSKSALSTSSFPSAKVLDFNADINVDEKDFILSQYFF